MNRTTLVKLGLLLDFAGAVVVSFSGYFGLAAGFGGPIVWGRGLWRILWWLGWAFIAAGFPFQWIALHEMEKHSRTIHWDTGKSILLILILLLLIFSGTSVFQYIRGAKLPDLLTQASIYLALLGIGFSYWLSLTSIRRIDKSLYPDDFEVQIVGSSSVGYRKNHVYPIHVEEKAIHFKNVGFRFGIRNASEKYPASNVFVTIRFEKFKFVVDGKELSDDSDNIVIRQKMHETYKNFQCLTVDNAVLSTGAGNSRTDLVGIGIIIPNIPPDINIFFFIPIDLQLKEHTGIVVVGVNKMNYVFNYRIAESPPDNSILMRAESTGVSTEATPIDIPYFGPSGATPAVSMDLEKK